MKIAHISDIHYRKKERHEEYREVLEALYKRLYVLGVNRIVLTGDLVHSKNELSPELVVELEDMLERLHNIAPVDIILGNHDLNLNNITRLDALSPIVNADNLHQVNLFKNSGLIQASDCKADIVYGVFSLMDNGSVRLTPKMKEDGKIYIALYHGPIAGCVTDKGYKFSDTKTTMSSFKNFDFVFLGDIHRNQFMRKNKTAAYAGSLIQQNHGESLDKGFLLWDIDEKTKESTCTFHKIENRYGFYTLNVDGKKLPDIHLPENVKMKVVWPVGDGDLSRTKVAKINSMIHKKYNPASMSLVFKPEKTTSIGGVSATIDINQEESRTDLLKSFFETENKSILEKIIEKDKEVHNLIDEDEFSESHGSTWELKKMTIKNFMSYGDTVEFDFEALSGVVGIFGENAVGKSVVIDALLYALFNKTTRGVKNEELPNKRLGNATCEVSLRFVVDGVEYHILRSTTRKETKTGNISATNKIEFEKIIGDVVEDLTEKSKGGTENVIRNLIGTYNDFLTTTLTTQNKEQSNVGEFIHLMPAQRTDNIIRFLGLDMFTLKHNIASDQLKEAELGIKQGDVDQRLFSLKLNKTSLKETNEKIEGVEIDIEKVRNEIEETRDSIEGFRKSLVGGISVDQSEEELAEELENEEKQLELLNDSLLELNNKKETLSKKILSIESEYVFDESKLSELGKKKESYRVLSGKVDSANKKIDVNKGILKGLKSDLDKGSNCPVEDDSRHMKCGFLKGYVDKQKMCDDLVKETKEIIEQAKILKDKRDGEKYSIDALEEQQRVRGALAKAYHRVEQIKTDIAKIEGKIEVKEMSVKLVAGKIKVAKKNSGSIGVNKRIKDSIANLEKSLEDLVRRKEWFDDDLVDLKAKRSTLEVKIKEIEEKIEEVKKTEEEANILRLYCSAMHRNGIPIKVLRGFIPKINYEINRILGNVVKFGVMMNIEEVGSSYNINVLMRGDEEVDDTRPAKMASGQEKLLINFAIRYALIYVSNLNKLNSWFIDEGFGVLHPNNLPSVEYFFDNVREMFKNVFIITHIDYLKDVADHVYSVELNGGISSVKYST